MLLIDGVKYEEWVPEGPRAEEEFEQVVKEHTQEIFGEQSIYLDRKQKLKSLSGIGSIPDGYVILLGDAPQWHIVEVELSSHLPHEHIVSQLNKFTLGIKNPTTQNNLVKVIYDYIIGDGFLILKLKKETNCVDIHKFIADLIYKPPALTIIIEKKTDELEEALEIFRRDYQTRIVEFQTFTREGLGLGVHAHLFEPLYKPTLQPSIPTPLITSPISVERPQKMVEQVTVKDLMEANIIRVGQVIYKLYKGQRFEGKVLNGGSIELAHTGKKFDSLSMAAVQITGINVNGWIWWHTTRADDTECVLNELRKEYLNKPSP